MAHNNTPQHTTETYQNNIVFPKSYNQKTIKENYKSIFTVFPIQRGFGTILGNIFRRTILSSLRGVAVSAVKSEKFVNLYATVEGVKEECFTIVTNLRDLVIKMEKSEKATLRLSANQAGNVYASSIKTVGDVEILNPDLHILTLNEGNSIEIDIEVEAGIGQTKSPGEDIVLGRIEVDRIFTPVRKVTMNVSNINNASNYENNISHDKLEISIETDGSVSPKEALETAAAISKEFFVCFTQFPEKSMNISSPSQSLICDIDQHLSRRIDDLELSVRSTNCLKTEKIFYIGQLVEKSEADMLRLTNFGRKSLNEIIVVLQPVGLSLGMTLPTGWKAPTDNTEQQ
jgi:DNA-directed RNA polymerase subunit alpha